MNHRKKILSAFVALFFVSSAVADNCFEAKDCCKVCKPVTCFIPRSTGANTVREAVGWQDLINRCGDGEYHGAFAVALEYAQSFRSERLAQCLFGEDVSICDCCSTIGVSGSCVENRNCRDWLADYFCLPTDFKSQITVCPEIKNFTADLQFYLGLDEWREGMYFRLNLPITYTRWELGCCEQVCEEGTNPHPAGYFCCESIPRTDLLNNALEYLSGCSCPKTLCENGAHPVTFQSLCVCKFYCDCCCPLHTTRLADVEAVLGWNFCCDEDRTLGANLRVVAPTGNKKCCGFLFEPVVGNSGHWEAGFGINARKVLRHYEDSDSSLTLYVDANVTHLFKACQTRCFDLCCQPNSRYALAQRLAPTTSDTELLGLGADCNTSFGNGNISRLKFANEFAPVANITNSNVEVSVPVQGDLMIKLAWDNGRGFQWDLGYNFFAKSCEHICRCSSQCCDDELDGKTWALKGDAHVFGFVCGSGSEVCHPLAATQSNATVHSGLNRPVLEDPCSVDALAAAQNRKIDNPECAANGNNRLCSTPTAPETPENRINTSINPVALTVCDLDFSSQRQLTHKLFTHINYTWEDKEDWTPFLGVGASVEFAQSSCPDCDCKTNCGSCNSCDNNGSCSNNNCGSCCKRSCGTSCGTSCNSCCGPCSGGGSCERCCGNACCNPCNCSLCGLNQWAVWLKGGFVFD